MEALDHLPDSDIKDALQELPEDDQIVVDNASQNRLNEKPRTKGDKVYIDFNPSECRLSDAD